MCGSATWKISDKNEIDYWFLSHKIPLTIERILRFKFNMNYYQMYIMEVLVRISNSYSITQNPFFHEHKVPDESWNLHQICFSTKKMFYKNYGSSQILQACRVHCNFIRNVAGSSNDFLLVTQALLGAILSRPRGAPADKPAKDALRMRWAYHLNDNAHLSAQPRALVLKIHCISP
jgi:hypothetical protein